MEGERVSHLHFSRTRMSLSSVMTALARPHLTRKATWASASATRIGYIGYVGCTRLRERNRGARVKRRANLSQQRHQPGGAFLPEPKLHLSLQPGYKAADSSQLGPRQPGGGVVGSCQGRRSWLHGTVDTGVFPPNSGSHESLHRLSSSTHGSFESKKNDTTQPAGPEMACSPERRSITAGHGKFLLL